MMIGHEIHRALDALEYQYGAELDALPRNEADALAIDCYHGRERFGFRLYRKLGCRAKAVRPDLLRQLARQREDAS